MLEGSALRSATSNAAQLKVHLLALLEACAPTIAPKLFN